MKTGMRRSCALLVIVLPALEVGQASAEDAVNEAKAAIVACESNLTSFPRYQCRYTITHASALSAEKALSGEWVNAARCNFHLVADGDREKQESSARLDGGTEKRGKPIKTHKQGIMTSELSSVRVDFMPFAAVKAGRQGLRYSSPLETAYVFAEDMENKRIDTSPLTYGWLFEPREKRSLSAHLEQCERQKASLAAFGMKVVDDIPVMHVRFSLGYGTQDYYLDPQRAYLPLKVDVLTKTTTGDAETTFLLRDAKQLSRGRWFPTHVLQIIPGDKPSDRVSVRDYKVTELEVDAKPSEADFAITIPAGTPVQWHDHIPGQSFRLRQEEKVGPDDIARLAQMLKDKPNEPLMDTAVRPQGGWGPWWAWGAAAIGAALLAATFAYRRFRTA